MPMEQGTKASARRVTERHMIWPAQVLSYKIRKLKINPLRERAKKCIETKFDFRALHDQILGSGRLSLSMLEAPWMLGLGKSIIYRLKLSGNVWCFHAFLFGVAFAAGFFASFVFDLAVRFVFDSAVAFLSDGGT